MFTMTDDTTLTNPSVPRYGIPSSKEDTLLTDFTQVASSIFKSKDKDEDDTRKTRKIRADLVRNYIATPEPEATSIFQKIINFLKG